MMSNDNCSQYQAKKEPRTKFSVLFCSVVKNALTRYALEPARGRLSSCPALATASWLWQEPELPLRPKRPALVASGQWCNCFSPFGETICTARCFLLQAFRLLTAKLLYSASWCLSFSSLSSLSVDYRLMNY